MSSIVSILVAGSLFGGINPELRPHLLAYEDLGPRLEIEVDQDGVYRLSYGELRSAGMEVDSLDPRNLVMRSQGREVAIQIIGEEDGVFDPDDYLLFFGQRFTGERLAEFYQDVMTGSGAVNNWLWACRDCDLSGLFENYTDTNVYWLFASDRRGLRMQGVDGTPVEAPSPLSYRAVVRAERDVKWWAFEFGSEESWFWDEIKGQALIRIKGQTAEDAQAEIVDKPIHRSYPIELSGVVAGQEPAKVVLELASLRESPGNPDHRASFTINRVNEPLQDVEWDGTVRQRLEGEIAQTELRDGVNEMHLSLHGVSKLGLPLPVSDVRVYFDWVEVEYSRRFLAINNAIHFSYLPGEWLFRIEGFTSYRLVALDVTNPLAPRSISNYQVDSGSFPGIRFGWRGQTAAEFYVISEDAIQAPKSLRFYTPPRFEAEADYVLIGHPDLAVGMDQLARYRASQGLRPLSINVLDLYREFNFGIRHPIAIKNFLAYALTNWSLTPRYVILVGGGHFNLRGSPDWADPVQYQLPNLAYVDPRQGEVDSPNLLATLSGGDLLPDVDLARIPVRNPAELYRFIKKVQRYEALDEADWQRRVLFLVDNPDAGGEFEFVVDRAIDGQLRKTVVDRIGLRDSRCRKAGDESCSSTKEAFLEYLNRRGAGLLVFTGHATVDRWTHEAVFEAKDVEKLANEARLPILFSMTCLDGFWSHPDKVNLVSRLLFAEGGIIGAFSSTGVGMLLGQNQLLSGFLRGVASLQEPRLGDLARTAREALARTGGFNDLHQTYILFGDPALKIPPALIRAVP